MDEIGENLLRRREKINIIGTEFWSNQSTSLITSAHHCINTGNMQRVDDVAVEREVQTVWLFASGRHCIHLLDVWNMPRLHFSGTCVFNWTLISTNIAVVNTRESKLKSKSNITSPRSIARRRSSSSTQQDNVDIGFNLELDHVRPSKLYNPMLSIGCSR